MKSTETQSEPQSEPIGEIVSASITGFVAESFQKKEDESLAYRPAFGSFLKAETIEDGISIIAVVFNVVTNSRDNNHKPVALGLSRQQLKLEQPHIFSLLSTEIHALTIGYLQGKKVFTHLPPLPPLVHDFVFACANDEVSQMTESLDFLRLLVSTSNIPQDELIAAVIRHAHQARNFSYPFLIQSGQALSHIFQDDYDRLVSVIQKIRF